MKREKIFYKENNSFILTLISAFIFQILSSTFAFATPGRILELGGSNYTMYDNGNTTPSTTSWDGTVRPVIATYHLNPSAVESQLRTMYLAGQRKIALVLWYMPFDNPVSIPNTITPDVWAHIANSKGGHLSLQAEDNLKSILNLIKNIGYTSVTLRFATQGGADPRGQNPPWNSGWSESQYLENLNFMINTRNIMENALSSSQVQRIYDLGLELGGIDQNQNLTYTRRMWADYFNRYGKSDTYGFSVAVASGRMARLIQTYDSVGVRPDRYAIDSYGEGQGDEINTALSYTYNELAAAGESAKPVIIAETYANDQNIINRINSALATIPLTIQYIMQWPTNGLASGWPQVITLTPPAQYEKYGGSTATGGSIIASSCVLPSNSSVCSTQVSWSSVNATNAAVYAGGNLMVPNPNGTVVVPWIAGLSTFELRSNQGTLATTTITALPSPTPYLSNKSLIGCDTFNCVTVKGQNLLSGCSANIFTPDWSAGNGGSALLASVTNANCQGDNITFTVPSWIQNAYSNINVNINNPNGAWSEPVLISIARPTPVLYKAGLGGAGNHSVWVTASNIPSDCTVGIFTPNWSAVNMFPGNAALLASVSANCQLNSVTFAIPSWIYNTYNAINFNVSTSYGQWSIPMYISIIP